METNNTSSGLKMRKARLCVGVLLACMLLCVPAGARAQEEPSDVDPQNFLVSSFDADYYLDRAANKASTMSVTEKIVAEFPDIDQNHGIERVIPRTYQNHSVDLTFDKIVDADGQDLPYTVNTSSDSMTLRIGNPYQYAHGTHTYVISYHMRNVTSNYKDHDELYWNTNGTDWPQVFGEVTARIHIPASIASSMQEQRRCYTGGIGETTQDCTITKTTEDGGGTLIAVQSNSSLGAYQTLSFVLGFAPGTFLPYHMPVWQLVLLIAGIIVLGVAPPAAALWIMLRQWLKYGRDAKSRGIIVPQYLPPKELSVLGSSELLNQSFYTTAISAQIIDLAVRHYVKVYEKKQKAMFIEHTNYWLELTKAPDDLRSEERAVITMLFGDTPKVGDQVNLSDQKNKLYKQAQAIGKTVDVQLAEEGYFIRPPQKIRQTCLTCGGVLVAVGWIFPPYTLGLFVAGVIVIAMAWLMPARTKKGVDMRDYLYGLRDYMKLAEADRIKALQSPNGALTEKIDTADERQMIKLYERLLPYAMLFGIEKDWAKQFADLYHEQSPAWYSGSSTFNAVYFAGAMHSIALTGSEASSSPGGSGSGFSGGGAGGGGGGGGGGGW